MSCPNPPLLPPLLLLLLLGGRDTPSVFSSRLSVANGGFSTGFFIAPLRKHFVGVSLVFKVHVKHRPFVAHALQHSRGLLIDSVSITSAAPFVQVPFFQVDGLHEFSPSGVESTSGACVANAVRSHAPYIAKYSYRKSLTEG